MWEIHCDFSGGVSVHRRGSFRRQNRGRDGRRKYAAAAYRRSSGPPEALKFSNGRAKAFSRPAAAGWEENRQRGCKSWEQAPCGWTGWGSWHALGLAAVSLSWRCRRGWLGVEGAGLLAALGGQQALGGRLASGRLVQRLRVRSWGFTQLLVSGCRDSGVAGSPRLRSCARLACWRFASGPGGCTWCSAK